MAKKQATATKGEIPKTPEEIRERARNRKPDSAAFAKSARRTDAAIKGGNFEWNRSFSTVDQVPIHYFRVRDESVTGIICEEESELWKGFTFKMLCDRQDVPGLAPTIHDPPQLIRLPGNRLLRKAITDAKCHYLRVRVTYLGKRFKTSRHYEKVYRVESAPESHDIGKAGRELLAKAAKEAKTKRGEK